MIDALIVILVSTIIISEITLSIWIIFSKILVKYKRRTTGLSLNELLVSLNAIIENEISVYEKSIFEGGKRVGTTAQFENYYRDLVERILSDLSDDFFDKMEPYMKKEAVVALICRTIKGYLGGKVAE